MRTHRYRIIVAGGLSEIGREAFSDFRIEANGTNTALVRDLDQAASTARSTASCHSASSSSSYAA